MPIGYRARGQDARRLGEFANQFGERLINVRARIAQARRAKDVSDYLGQVESDYSNEIAGDPSPENVYRRAAIARGRAGQLGSAPEADKAINRFDEEMRSARTGIAARQKPTVQSTQDIPLQRGGMRRLIGYGSSPDQISDYEVLNLADPSPDMTEYQREMLDLRRENKGKGNENDLTNLHLKREQLGKTINEFQNRFNAAEAKAAEDGTTNTTFPKEYVVAQKQKLQNELDLVKKQILAKGGMVDEGVQPLTGPPPLLARPGDQQPKQSAVTQSSTGMPKPKQGETKAAYIERLKSLGYTIK